MDEEYSPNEEMYRRFRASLTQPVSERFFDEDELVALYDYAGDQNDDYIQLEVLLCGARLYPDSRALAERRALLYLETTDEETNERTQAAEKFLADNPDVSSPIFDIVRLEINPPENPGNALSFVLNSYPEFSDEEIIRLINLALNLQADSWLMENFETLKKKAQYLPSLLFEMARNASETGDNAFLEKVAEELIELEPFNVRYWLFLLKAQGALDKQEEARTTFDYAKALAADDPTATLWVVEIVYHNAPFLNGELIEPLSNLAKANPNDFRFVDYLCAVYSALNLNRKASLTLCDFLDNNPTDRQALRLAMIFNIPNLEDYIARFFEMSPPPGMLISEVVELSHELSLRGAYVAVDALVSAFLGESLVFLDEMLFCTWIEALYALKKWQKIIEVAKTNAAMLDASSAVALKGSAVSFAYTIALIRTGNFETAKEYAQKVQPMYESFMSAAPMPVRMNIAALLRLFNLLDVHDASESMFWQYYDPLRYGK